MQPFVRIQSDDFQQAEHYAALANGTSAGAVVTFVGRVREFTQPHDSGLSQNMWLEHYPGMTEKVLHRLAEQAAARWSLFGVRMIHRVGQLRAGEQIVFVGVSAAHRQEAFLACEYLMDYLKTKAPFWKREGDQWVSAKESDQEAARRWTTDV